MGTAPVRRASRRRRAAGLRVLLLIGPATRVIQDIRAEPQRQRQEKELRFLSIYFDLCVSAPPRENFFATCQNTRRRAGRLVRLLLARRVDVIRLRELDERFDRDSRTCERPRVGRARRAVVDYAHSELRQELAAHLIQQLAIAALQTRESTAFDDLDLFPLRRELLGKLHCLRTIARDSRCEFAPAVGLLHLGDRFRRRFDRRNQLDLRTRRPHDTAPAIDVAYTDLRLRAQLAEDLLELRFQTLARVERREALIVERELLRLPDRLDGLRLLAPGNRAQTEQGKYP